MNPETALSLPGHDEADWLESLLREACPGAIPDEGFSVRVMQSLPSPMSAAQAREQLEIAARRNRRFEWFTLIGAAAGCVLAYWGSHWPQSDQLASNIMALLDFRPVSVEVLAPWLASLFSAAVLAYVMQKE